MNLQAEERSSNKKEENKYSEEKLKAIILVLFKTLILFKEIFQNPNDFHIEKIPFGQALKELHGELHKLNLEIN